MHSCLYFSRLGGANRWSVRSFKPTAFHWSKTSSISIRPQLNASRRSRSQHGHLCTYSTVSSSKAVGHQSPYPIQKQYLADAHSGEVVRKVEPRKVRSQTLRERFLHREHKCLTWRQYLRRMQNWKRKALGVSLFRVALRKSKPLPWKQYRRQKFLELKTQFLKQFRLFPNASRSPVVNGQGSTIKGISSSIQEASEALVDISRDIKKISRRVKSISRVIRKHSGSTQKQLGHRPSKPRWLISSAGDFDLNAASHSNIMTLQKAAAFEDVGRKILARWVDLPCGSKRAQYWQEVRKLGIPPSLPCILLHHLNKSKNVDDFQTKGDIAFQEAALENLTSQGFTVSDVNNWAWVVSGFTPDIRAKRFLSISSKRPSFLLLEILRGDLFRVRNLKMLLIYVWDLILGHSRTNLPNMSEVEIDNLISWSEVAATHSLSSTHNSILTVETTSIRIFKSLLYQVRRLWPPAMVSIAHMIPPYIQATLDGASRDTPALDSFAHARLSKLYNTMLDQLSRPSSINPFKSMAHNWDAQRVLLKMASNFEPPLSMDHKSYRAIVQVLAASKKTGRESRVAHLRTRSWPPWRIEQDGMDAQRSPEEDLSRVVSALARTQEAGYHLSVQDAAMKIIGGQEIDGTPTIHTRMFQKPIPHHYPRGNIESEPEIWTARIQATRDVEEAWSAFDRFREAGGRPNKSLYFAMLEKLIYECIRLDRRSKHNGVPGDGKELLSPSNDNFSTSYKLKRHPPSFESLYKDMIIAEIRPSGRFLDLIVAKARTIDDGVNYLWDSGRLSSQALSFFKSPGHRRPYPDVSRGLTVQNFAAFLDLLCRFAPRVAPRAGTLGANETSCQGNGNPIIRPPDDSAESTDAPPGRRWEWGIIELSPRTSAGQRYPNPLLLATQLLSDRKPLFRPAWYTVFQVLARRGTIIDRSASGIRNDVLAWRVLETLLKDFFKTGVPGMELDPKGFTIVCRGAEKAVLASSDPSISDEDAVFISAVGTVPALLKAEFRKLSETNNEDYIIPKLLHSIAGVHLHAYVRVMGLLKDYEEIVSVLRWMVEHHEVLDSIADQAANGHTSLRTTLIAIRVFCKNPEYAAEAQQLVESVDLWTDSWGGWPRDEEVQQYVRAGERTLFVDAVSFS